MFSTPFRPEENCDLRKKTWVYLLWTVLSFPWPIYSQKHRFVFASTQHNPSMFGSVEYGDLQCHADAISPTQCSANCCCCSQSEVRKASPNEGHSGKKKFSFSGVLYEIIGFRILKKFSQRINARLVITIGHSNVLLKFRNFQEISIGHQPTQFAHQLNMFGDSPLNLFQ